MRYATFLNQDHLSRRHIPIFRSTSYEGGIMEKQDLGFEIHLSQSYEQALDSVIAALKAEGFGVITRIDMQATMKEKLGVHFRPYTILGACNPPLAHRALTTDSLAGLLLPCNVTVEHEMDSSSIVRIIDPEIMLSAGSMGENQVMRQIAKEARSKLTRVAEMLSQPGAAA
jgi:uncharacterized protein (DUF302 family)